MKLASYGPPGAEQPGVLDGDTIVPLAPLLHQLGVTHADMQTVLGLLPAIRDRLATLVAGTAGALRLALGATRLGPPVPAPGKIVLLGANYRSHVTSSPVSGGELPTKPMLLSKPASTLVGCRDDVVRPPETTELDYEVELVVVIGAPGRRIPAGRAHDHIAGYTVANDVTAHDELLGDYPRIPFYTQFLRGKGFDTFLPMGPWITTAEEVVNPGDLAVQLWVDDELRMDANTSDMVSDVAAVVAEVSGVMTLHPGDLILTGSPPGGGGHHDPPRYVEPGQVMRVRIDGLGDLVNRVVQEGAGA